jgi:hypothetical protein
LGGVDIGGATASSYTTAATTYLNNGQVYRVVVTNNQGAVTSNNATITVNASPIITTNPSAATVTVPATNTLTCAATGAPTPIYQWQLNASNISGATSASYTTPATVSTDNGNAYRCVATNSGGSATSTAATLTVYFLPGVTNPSNVTVTAPASAAFSSTVTGNPTPTVQWQRDGIDISGATSSGYTLNPTAIGDNATAYRIIATNSVGNATSTAATLTVNDRPRVVTNPSTVTVNPPNVGTFSAAFTGTATVTYQWQLNSANIGGATSASYTTPATILSDSGRVYRCIANNAYGADTTTQGLLRVTNAIIRRNTGSQMRRILHKLGIH